MTRNTRQRRRSDAPTEPAIHHEYAALLPKTQIQSMTKEATVVLLLTMMTAVLWNHLRPEMNRPQLQQSFLLQFCQHANTVCAPGMQAVQTQTYSGTTTETKQPIRKGTTVLKIPRKLQIWDTDALGNESIVEILGSLNGDLDSAAVLALFLARWQRRLHDDAVFLESSMQQEPIFVSYLLQQLPLYEQYESYHPILWNDNLLEQLLPKRSLSYAYIKDIQHLIHSEYVTLAEHVDRKEYYAARLAVLTRAFGTKAMSKSTINHSGSYAMVPILDSFDHQSPPNVGFVTSSNGDCVVTALTNFRGKIHDSYGKASDPHLFSRYGFVNGDGTDYTQAGINLWHLVKPQDGESDQPTTLADDYRLPILRYLQYDDGYEDCVGPPIDEHGAPSVASFGRKAWTLKQLKYKFLLKRAHSFKHWIVTVSPRNKEKRKGVPEIDMATIQLNATSIFSTCRLLSLTHEDYDGQAAAIVENALNDLDFVLSPTRDGLEFRTLFCISRMTSTALDRFTSTVEQEKDLISSYDTGSSEWMTAHLRLGEMQTLQALKRISFGKLRADFSEQVLGSSPAFSIRDQPCPKEFLLPLLSLASEK
jgi:hypothetical protein